MPNNTAPDPASQVTQGLTPAVVGHIIGTLAPVTPTPKTSLIATLLKKIPILGDWLAEVWVTRNWKHLAGVGAVMWFFFIYPLLVPWIAAVAINRGILFDFQDNYADTVRSAFKVKEMAEKLSNETNERLDYFQVIEFLGDARDPRSYDIPVALMQRVKLQIDKAELRTKNPTTCEIPKAFSRKGVELMKVKIASKEVLSALNQSEAISLTMSEEIWRGIVPTIQTPGRIQITFAPVKELQSGCDGLEFEVRATIEVFKEIVKPPKPQPGAVVAVKGNPQ